VVAVVVAPAVVEVVARPASTCNAYGTSSPVAVAVAVVAQLGGLVAPAVVAVVVAVESG